MTIIGNRREGKSRNQVPLQVRIDKIDLQSRARFVNIRASIQLVEQFFEVRSDKIYWR